MGEKFFNSYEDKPSPGSEDMFLLWDNTEQKVKNVKVKNVSKYTESKFPTIPTVPEWAKAEEKPTYTASEVGALPDTTEIPKNLSDLQDDAEHRTVTDTEKQSWNANLPNTQALTITYNGRTYTYNGSEAVAITIETGGIERIEKLYTDTTVTLEPNKLYIFPEMTSLTYTIGEGTGEVHFIFRSGATATRVVHPSNVNIGSFMVDANKIYEVSILEGLLTSQNWSVS